MFNSMSYYSKIKQCDYCKDLDCEIVMVNTKLGCLCPYCSRMVEGREKDTTAEKAQMAIEIETY